MNWTVNLDYALTTRHGRGQASPKIIRILKEANVRPVGDSNIMYAGETSDLPTLAEKLGEVLNLLANPGTPSKPRFVVLTIHAKPGPGQRA